MAHIFGSIWDRFNRNALNDLSKSVEQQGKTIQDLVAEGQLTPTQYATLIQSVNGLVKSGHVDKSDLTSEFKNEIEGFSAQLTQRAKIDEVRLNTTKIEPEDWSERALALATGQGTVDILSIPQPNSVGFAELSPSLESELVANKTYTPERKELSDYTNALSATPDSIYINKDAMRGKGKVTLHLRSRTNGSLYVVLLKKPLDSNLNYTVKEIKSVSVLEGNNAIDTGFSVTGDGTEFIGVVGLNHGAVAINYKTADTPGNYAGVEGFTLDTITFDARLSSTTRDLSFYTEVIQSRLSDIEEQLKNGGVSNKTVDLTIFMGQSNMAGRGTSSEAPTVPSGHGYEFRSVTDPARLYPIAEPFGFSENVTGAIDDGTNKTGSMVSSFVNAYYELTSIPIVGVSASEGGTRTTVWGPGSAKLNDAIDRLNTAKTWLRSNGYTIRHINMVWCQGESDGDNSLPKDDYKNRLKAITEEMMKHGVEKCFVVRIGNHRDDATLYDEIIEAQTELCQTYENAVLISTKFANMANKGLMADPFHYTQEGYNIVGEEAGKNMAFYASNQKEPYMFDPEYNNLYFSRNS